MSLLKMVELPLNTIYALRAGDWLLLIECIRLILSYTFGYDHVNYAMYLTAMQRHMLLLPKVLNGDFVAQLTSGSKFSR